MKTAVAAFAALVVLADPAMTLYQEVNDDQADIVCSTELRSYGELQEDFPEAEIPVPDDVEEKCDISTFLGGETENSNQSEPDEGAQDPEQGSE